jgi:hypothetical protein
MLSFLGPACELWGHHIRALAQQKRRLGQIIGHMWSTLQNKQIWLRFCTCLLRSQLACGRVSFGPIHRVVRELAIFFVWVERLV